LAFTRNLSPEVHVRGASVLPNVTWLWRFPLANLAWSTLPANMPAPLVENN
jgi:hypothetical protein